MTEFKYRPLRDRVLVQPKKAEEKTASGIFIPNSAQEKPQKGIVIAVGEGSPGIPTPLQVGDLVIYGQYGGTEITIDDVDYLIMREDDILLIEND